MIIDGKEIASEIFKNLSQELKGLSRTPRLVAFTCAPQFETTKFLTLKQKKAAEIGIEVEVRELPEKSTTESCIQKLHEAVPTCEGIVVQLPFPKHINTNMLLASIPPSHDVDALSGSSDGIFPPVIGAMVTILEKEKFDVKGKQVLVVGNGRLVGKPAAEWFLSHGAYVEVITKESGDIEKYAYAVDVIVLGAGSPGLLKPHMLKDGVVILDAGTSEEGGELRGDADPACAEKALLFTPVPGGIGPITIAILLQNLVVLASRSSKG